MDLSRAVVQRRLQYSKFFQVFHIWFDKSWDRILCWYNKLVEMESEDDPTEKPAALISSDKKDALQVIPAL